MKKITEMNDEQNSIVLRRGAKNTYNWEIKVYGESLSEIVDKIYLANNELKKLYSKLKEN